MTGSIADAAPNGGKPAPNYRSLPEMLPRHSFCRSPHGVSYVNLSASLVNIKVVNACQLIQGPEWWACPAQVCLQARTHEPAQDRQAYAVSLVTLRRGGGARRRRFVPNSCVQLVHWIRPVSAHKLKLWKSWKNENKIPNWCIRGSSRLTPAIRRQVCASTSWVGSCSKLTEVIPTDASFAVFFLQAVASTASWEELPFAAAVKSTAGSPGRLKTSSI